MLLFSRTNCARLTSNDKQQQQIDPKLGASISVRWEELSKLFVYGQTKRVIPTKVNLSIFRGFES